MDNKKVNFESALEATMYRDEIVRCDLSESGLNKDITLSDIYELTKREFADETFKKVILTMLEAGMYHILNTDLELLVKQRAVITNVDTDQGTKFLKLVEHGCGDDEFEGGRLMADHFPTIRTEKLIKAGIDKSLSKYGIK